MFISLRSHNLIVEALKQQIADLKESRDFYRSAWTEEKGKGFSTAVKVNDSERSSEAQPESTGVRPSLGIDAGWSEDDRDLFKMWTPGNVANGEDPLEVWERKFGAQPPLMALTV